MDVLCRPMLGICEKPWPTSLAQNVRTNAMWWALDGSMSKSVQGAAAPARIFDEVSGRCRECENETGRRWSGAWLEMETSTAQLSYFCDPRSCCVKSHDFVDVWDGCRGEMVSGFDGMRRWKM